MSGKLPSITQGVEEPSSTTRQHALTWGLLPGHNGEIPWGVGPKTGRKFLVQKSHTEFESDQGALGPDPDPKPIGPKHIPMKPSKMSLGGAMSGDLEVHLTHPTRVTLMPHKGTWTAAGSVINELKSDA